MDYQTDPVIEREDPSKNNKFARLIDASYRPFFQLNSSISELKKENALRTDRQTDGPTDGQTLS